MQSQVFHLRVGEGRRIVLPAEACSEIGVEIGDTVSLRVDDHKITLHSVDQTIERFQSLLGTKVRPGVSLVDELIAERESSATHE